MRRRSGRTGRGPSQAAKSRPGTPESFSSSAPGSILVEIEKPIYGGNFLARDEGKAVFVPLVLPGEQAKVRVVDARRGYATAELDELVLASPQRIAAKCPHFGECGGCHYQHADYAMQLRMKQDVLRETLRRGAVAPPENLDVLSGEPWAYRNRIRLAFDAQGKPGYRGRRSHAVIPIRECPIAAPLLVRAALAAADVLRSMRPAFRPEEIALFTNADETALLVTLFVAGASKAPLDAFAAALRERIPQLIGVELVIEDEGHGFSRTIAQWGNASLMYQAASAEYRVGHRAFFQVNRWLVDALVDRVTAGYSGALAWDLFAGVGLFAGRLANSFHSVVAVESAPVATAALAANLDSTTGVTVRSTTVRFLREHRGGPQPDLVVVDPPRTGLGPDVTAMIAEVAPPAMVYVSCDPATLARDLRDLLAAGYIVESMTLADLFPQTFHLETVVRMRLP